MVLDSIAAKPVTTLFDPDELNLLKKLVKNPLDTISQLSKKIGLTIETTQKIFNKLIRKSNLWFGAFVDVKKIGLTEYCIFLETRNAALVRKIFQNFPYCTIIYRVYGPTDLFIIVDLPNENKEFLVKVLKEFQDLGVINRFFISEPIKHYYNINFDYYDEQQGKWCIYWDEWSLFLREQLQKKLQVDISEESKLIKRSIKFDQLDIQIINLLLSNSRISYSEVGRLTNISGTYARKKVKNLLDNEVLSPGMGSYKIGLNDVTHVLIDCNLHIAAALAIAFNKLPSWRGALLKGDINGIVGMLFIPNGEIESFFKTLDENLIRPSLVNRCLFHTTGPWTSWRRGLPELYFEGKWIFDERKFIEDFRAALRR
jgi:DNA-binding Lrp family transcriptional regulator